MCEKQKISIFNLEDLKLSAFCQQVPLANEVDPCMEKKTQCQYTQVDKIIKIHTKIHVSFEEK